MEQKKILNVFDLSPPRERCGPFKPVISKAMKGKILGINGKFVSSLAPNKSAPLGSLDRMSLTDMIEKELRIGRRDQVRKLSGY